MEQHILVVDDEPTVRELLQSQLTFLGYPVHALDNGEAALALADNGKPPAVALLDIEMPGMPGVELLRRLQALDKDIQVIMVSGRQDLGTVRTCVREGAYDYLAKPFDLEDLRTTLERALERRRLTIQNRAYKAHLEKKVDEKTHELRQTRDIALHTLAKLAESRDSETGFHLERIAEYSRVLAKALRDGTYADRIHDDFVKEVVESSPLHDIGKVGIPDAILRKPGPLTDEEMAIMRTHTTIGGDTLRTVLDRYDVGPTFLDMAMDIAYSHHERWDGGGYPDGLAGEDIPLPARIVALADAYDTITTRRPYKEPYSHEEAVRRIRIDRGLHFDPIIVDTFLACETTFARIHQQLHDQQPTLTSAAAETT
ncbi:MAG: HD domain-containing phosphohydrolase [Acidobacteriota bacterium]